jgi:hypothetical protein
VQPSETSQGLRRLARVLREHAESYDEGAPESLDRDTRAYAALHATASMLDGVARDFGLRLIV